MATLEDTKDPYWCAAWNQGCAFFIENLVSVHAQTGPSAPHEQRPVGGGMSLLNEGDG